VRRADADRYFNAPDRDFARTDEALRLRSIGPNNFITYKGPKTDLLTKTRLELEVPLVDGPESPEMLQRLLQHLGYRFVGLVEKCRTIYQLHRGEFDLEVCLDEVQGLGKFVELEIMAPEEQLESARAVVQEVARECQLSRSERKSYLEMLLEKDQCK
jgi:adenylate cyclase, class 2